MKKKLLISLGVLTLFLLGLFSLNQKNTIANLKKRHAYFLEHNPFNKSLRLSEKERLNQGIPPNKYFEREYILEMNPALGHPTPEKLFALQERLKAERKNEVRAQRAPGDNSGNPWVERGPNNIGGRTRAILFDPNDATHKRVFAGGVSGGLWVNNDITSSTSAWTRVSGITENISVTAFTVDPNNSNNIFVATGETYTGGDVTGNGIWRSTDGGATWTHVFGGKSGSTTTNSSGQFLVPGKFNVNDIKAWNNGGSTVIFAAVGANSFKYSGVNATFLGAFNYAFFKSTDNGATWTDVGIKVPPAVSHSYEVNDIEIAADNSIWIATKNTVFGDGGGAILRSTDGATFTLKYNVTNGRRTQIAVSGTNAGTVYVLGEVVTKDASNNVIAPFVSLLKTTDGFATSPTALTLPNDADTGIPANDFTRTQAFYDLMLEVDPTNDAIVYVGGVDSFRSSDSGTSWTQMTKWSNNNNLASKNIPLVHADFHALVFHPTNSDIAVLGNDGGVYYASSLVGALTSTTAISSRNKNYNVTQFYKGAIGQSTTSDMLLGGAQDNGSLFKAGATSGINGFTDIFSGDGAYEFIDKNGTYLIASFTNNTYSLYPLPYTGAGEIVIANDQTTGAFINPAGLDNNLNILYADGTKPASGSTAAVYQIARYNNIKTSPTRTNINDALLTNEPTAFAISPFTTATTTLFVGTDDGKVLKITNADGVATPVWTDLTSSSFVGSVSAINFGANENQIIVTFHNYGVVNVWYTTDGGTTWANKEGDLPDLPVKAVMMNPLNSNEVILGTDLGVWRTDTFSATSPTWIQSQNGMQNSKVTSFDLRTADNTVLASTYGRGLFTGKFLSGTLAVNQFDLAKKALTLYPAVSNGLITIKANKNIGDSSVNIFDMQGRLVYQNNLILNQLVENNLNLNLKSGIYILKVAANNINYSKKFIIK